MFTNKVYNKIKKQNGESFAKVLRDFHNGILEVPDIIQIVRYAGHTAKDAEANIKYYVSLVTKEEDEAGDVKEDPFTLLDQAGYDAFYADTAEKQDSISRYFKGDEKLCTFGTQRYNNYFIINAVKKNVDSIKREDFLGKEQRQDDYGTSVISIQVSRKGGFISIKNRYNHAVSGCDNTFKSNPDNIIKGLSASIQKYFNVSFSTKNSVLAEGFVLVGRNVFKQNREINGIIYGDIAYVKNGVIHEVDKTKGFFLMDYFIWDDSSKTFSIVDETIDECFHIEFNKAYGGLKTLHVRGYSLYDGDELLISTCCST